MLHAAFRATRARIPPPACNGFCLGASVTTRHNLGPIPSRTMRTSRRHRPRLTPEHLLLGGVLLVFIAGSVWVALGAGPMAAGGTDLRLGALPGLIPPVLHVLLGR